MHSPGREDAQSSEAAFATPKRIFFGVAAQSLIPETSAIPALQTIPYPTLESRTFLLLALGIPCCDQWQDILVRIWVVLASRVTLLASHVCHPHFQTGEQEADGEIPFMQEKDIWSQTQPNQAIRSPLIASNQRILFLLKEAIVEFLSHYHLLLCHSLIPGSLIIWLTLLLCYSLIAPIHNWGHAAVQYCYNSSLL